MANIQFPKKALEIVQAPIPEELIKERPGGGNKKLSYISGSTVIDCLNYAFDYLWDFEVIRVWKEESIDKFNPKYDKEPQPQGPVAHAMVRLTAYIPSVDGTLLPIYKMGTGSKSIMGGQGDQESIFKAATTDALKKAASLFGIGLALYRDEDEQEFFDALNAEPDPWTDEMSEKYAEQITYMQDYMTENDLDADAMGELIETFSEGAINSLDSIVPDNIEAFCTYLEGLKSAK